MQTTPLRILITGANRGIGFGLIEEILSHNQTKDWHVMMTSRDLAAGNQAVQDLKKQFPAASLSLWQLDLDKRESIDGLVGQLKHSGPVEILVNNAGVFCLQDESRKAFDLQMTTNFHGTRYFTEQLLTSGLIKDSGKIVFVSSGMGKFDDLPQKNPAAYALLKDYKTERSLEKLDQAIKMYETDYDTESKRALWPRYTYGATKLFLSIYAYILGRDQALLDKQIKVYACCPGFCLTNMTNAMKATPPLTYRQGGQNIYRMVTLTDSFDMNLQGEFFNSNGKVESLDKS